MKHLSVFSLLAFLFVVLSGTESFARSYNEKFLNIARGQIGVREYRGGSNPRIRGYFRKAVGRGMSDNVPWCSAFIGYVIKSAGHRGTNSLSARSWLRWGRRVSRPRPGDLVIFGRRRGGHVGIFVKFRGNRVVVIGGNQSNSVSYKAYSRYRVLGYRTAGGRGQKLRPARRQRYARGGRRGGYRRGRQYRVAVRRGRIMRARRRRRVSRRQTVRTVRVASSYPASGYRVASRARSHTIHDNFYGQLYN